MPGLVRAPLGRDRPWLLSYRALGLGDLLTAVPALRALRAAFPDHRHVLATSGWLTPLLPTIDAIDGWLEVEESAELPRVAYGADLAVNLHGRGPQSHRALLRAAPRRLVAFRNAEVAASVTMPEWPADEHEVTRWCRLLCEVGIPADRGALDLPPPDGSVAGPFRGATLIHPGAKAGARRWPSERFAAVARHEWEQGRTVLVTGSAAERGLALDVARRAGLPPSAALAGRLGLADLARLVASAGRLVCGDTGVAHLATAYGTPSVVLFGPVSPAHWGPPAERARSHRVLWAGSTGDPLGDRPDAGLLQLIPEQVIEVLERP